MQVSQRKSLPQRFSRTPVAAGVVLALASPTLLAQEAIEEIMVTAQKRSENLQDVPISIATIGTEAIQELNITNFKDYTQMLPSVASTPGLGAGSGSLVYMRGIATAGDGQATTSQPSVGMYLDELSITTITGNIDVHMYDVARVEALAGPQGTLYGASSQAGTLRVITNKPAIGETSMSVSASANSVDGGGNGFTVEGYVNIPTGDNSAIRLVGWSRSDAGWIDNVLGSRTHAGVLADPSDDVILTNTDKVEKDYNTLDTVGMRAALRVDLNDNWTISPTLMLQKSESEGAWGSDLGRSQTITSDTLYSNKYAVTHFQDEFNDDEWSMIGLTVEGSIGNFDIVYAGSYLERESEASYDYTDYSYWYDVYGTTGYYADLHFSESGPRTIPNQFVPGTFDTEDVGTRVMSGARFGDDFRFTKLNHELRISTDPSQRVRGLLGFFAQKQFHDFEQKWEVVGGVAPIMRLNGGTDPRFTDTVYLNSMFRTDRDFAWFASASFDITDDLEVTVGTRFFEPEVSVKGFFGFPIGFQGIWGTDGETQCDAVVGGDGPWDDGATEDFNGQEDWNDKPCLNVDKGIKEDGNVSRFNATWNATDDHMFYFTWSEGYRPGGIQRRPTLGTYVSDFLTNVEIGWKTQWADNRLQFNGALFTQDWDDIQIGLTGENAITLVDNGPSASVDGLEADILWLATDNLRISASVAFYDSQLEDDYCCVSGTGQPGDPGAVNLADKGTRLPVTADFKGNLVVRYHFPMGGAEGYVQGALVHEGDRDSDLDHVAANPIIGTLPAYTTLDLSAGMREDTWSLDLFVSNVTGADEPLFFTAQCTAETCGEQTYGVRIRPMTLGLRYTKNFDQ